MFAIVGQVSPRCQYFCGEEEILKESLEITRLKYLRFLSVLRQMPFVGVFRF
jgi:hypothetical protein